MEQLYKDFEKLVKKQQEHCRRLFREYGTDCYRIYDRQLPALPVAVDRYAEYVRIEIPDDVMDTERVRDSVQRMTYTTGDRVVVSRRPKGIGGEAPLRDELKRAKKVTVTEAELQYAVDLWTYRDTGLFLDHAVTRDFVRQQAAGMRVLNLFSYTGAFTVSAAAGGAAESVSVDLSKTYLAWMEENLKLNALNAPGHQRVQGDVKEFLTEGKKRWGSFSMIILDPPSFSNSRKTDGVFNVQRDYPWYIERCLDMLTDRGFILFSVHMQDFRFRHKLLPKLADVAEITRQTVPPGFSLKRLPHRCWVIRRQRGKSR